jgi:hypothetical protein
MLEYTDSAVTRNASEKKINSLLDFISASSDLDLLQVGPFFSFGPGTAACTTQAHSLCSAKHTAVNLQPCHSFGFT